MADLAASSVTRRRLLAGVAGGIGGLALVGLLPALESLIGRTVGAPELNQVIFTRLVGTTFRVSVGADRAEMLRLIAVRPLALTPSGPAPAGEGFAPLFSGSLFGAFGQGTYTVSHRSLGTFSMFLVPVGPAGPDHRYEAVFNRLWK